jgi:hypothetical protein
LQSALDSGKTVEQWIGRFNENGCSRIRWIELRRTGAMFEVWCFEADEFVGSGSIDLYEWVDTDIDAPAGMFSTLVDALGYSEIRFGASLGQLRARSRRI